MIFFAQPSSLIKKLLLKIQQNFIIQTSTDSSVIPLLPYPQGMTTPKSPHPNKLNYLFAQIRNKPRAQCFQKKILLIPDSPPCQIPSLSKALYKGPPSESSFVPNLGSKTSHQQLQSPQIVPITLPLVPLINTGSIFPKSPSSLNHQNSPTPTLSLASEFENSPQIFQKSSLTLPQFKNLPTSAP
ncbi:hypothetical protein O181_023867 [Austropuccinia psidii MF-1]|uniref:Uncharacterized protein n=1 Tax=Austropuccinia psidii MF-1 TaxID=1389203 RepID=A0A9Q3GYF0_9BASI|nr:hypothetical protein [Austropuccinia psidii MF-1]